MKSNPLFHDSTVTQGANIQTQFELSGCEVLDGDQIVLKIKIDSEIKHVQMQAKEGVYTTSVWMEHRKNFKYQFYLKRGGEVLSATGEKEALALHTIIETWIPVEKEIWELGFQSEMEKDLDNVEIVESVEPSDERFMDNLIEKWDL